MTTNSLSYFQSCWGKPVGVDKRKGASFDAPFLLLLKTLCFKVFRLLVALNLTANEEFRTEEFVSPHRDEARLNGESVTGEPVSVHYWEIFCQNC